MKRTVTDLAPQRRVLILVDESNVTSAAKVTNRKLDWQYRSRYKLAGH